MYWKSAEGSIVVCLLAYGCLVSLCNGVCVGREPRLSPSGEKPDGCMDDNIKRDLGSKWYKEKCMECTCDSDGLIDCCNRALVPIVEDEACEAVLNQTSCTYVIRRTDNSSEPCISMGSM